MLSDERIDSINNRDKELRSLGTSTTEENAKVGQEELSKRQDSNLFVPSNSDSSAEEVSKSCIGAQNSVEKEGLNTIVNSECDNKSENDLQLAKPIDVETETKELEISLCAKDISTTSYQDLTHSSIARIDDELLTSQDDDQTLKNKLRLKNLLKKSSSNSSTQNSLLSTSKSVRIDYLQRPLNTKVFLPWLSEVCGSEVTESMIWINLIKTHCYIDFKSIEDAQQCINKVSGLRYPSTSTAALVVNFTIVQACDAAQSPEAALRPGEWQNANLDSSSLINSSTDSVLGKRQGNSADNRKISKTGSKTFQRATEAALKSDSDKTHRQPLISQQEHINLSVPSFEVVFRKTIAEPVLLWMPVADEVAERRKRLKERLGPPTSKNGRR